MAAGPLVAANAEPGPARVLIVEDRALVAGKVERCIRSAGHIVADVVATVAAALAFIEQGPEMLDAAVLDIDLRGEAVYPVAGALRARQVPFLFLTGFGRPAIHPHWAEVTRIEKPFEGAELARTLSALLAGRLSAGRDRHGRQLSAPMRSAWENVRRSRDIVTEVRAWQEVYGLPPARKV